MNNEKKNLFQILFEKNTILKIYKKKIKNILNFAFFTLI